MPASTTFRVNKTTLPPEIFIFALLDFWQTHFPQQPSISFDRLAYGTGSLGQAFKLSENALVERLEMLPSPLRFDETAGLRLVLSSEPIQNLNKVTYLHQYYRGQQQDVTQ